MCTGHAFVKISIFCLVTFSFSFSVAGTPSNAPYIYYYSFEDQAFIIEHADGSDRRILASYLLPEGHTTISGAGWSPSGEWFAWTSKIPSGTGGLRNVYLVRRDGGEPLGIFSELITSITSIMWSPAADLLLVSYFDYDPGSNFEKVVVYDASNGDFRLLTDVIDIPVTSDGFYFYRKLWSPDGQYIALVGWKNMWLVPINREDETLIRSTEAEPSCNHNSFGALPHWFRDGRIGYLDSEGRSLIVENFRTQIISVVALPQGSIDIDRMDWSPDETYALLYTQPNPKESKFDLWVVSLADQSVRRIAVNVYLLEGCYQPFNESMWGSEGRASFITADKRLGVVTTSPLEVKIISPTETGWVPTLSPISWLNNKLYFIWYDDEADTQQLYRYDPLSTEIADVLPDNVIDSPIGYFAIQGDSLAYSSGASIFVRGMQTNFLSQMTFQADPYYGSIGVDSLIWHPDEEWLFLVSDHIETLHLVNIANRDGSIQRLLSLCHLDSASCFGWLPEIQDELNQP
jgi:hypothetical protein